MKYWEIIADNLSKAGWSWGCVSAIDSNGRTIWIADAHRDDNRKDKRTRAVSTDSICTMKAFFSIILAMAVAVGTAEAGPVKRAAYVAKTTAKTTKNVAHNVVKGTRRVVHTVVNAVTP